MRSSTILGSLGLMATAVAAADEVITMYIADNTNPQPLVGQVLGGHSDTTSYLITCADTVTSCDVDVPGGVTLVQAPSTYEMRAELDDEPYTVACNLDTEASLATCSIKLGASAWSDPFMETESEYPVTITEGTGVPISTPAPESAASVVATTTISESDATSTSTTPTPDPSADSEDEESDASNKTDSDNAAMAQVTGMAWSAGAVVMGVAAAVIVA
ncbi:hypothetical protein BDW74DRAFT_17645 [Aspergillus multicolor]|uniref:uncharacterized protein n=1 Tax=Aspergillus multicolor TaxID=41759 RepID=UPI003CCD039F